MKPKLLVFLLFVIFCAPAGAQNKFCVKGSEWHFAGNGGGFGTPYHTVVNVQAAYGGDTLEGPDTLRILNHSRFFYFNDFGFSGPTYIKQRGDTVLFRNSYSHHNRWQILYNFAAQTGHYWSDSIYVEGVVQVFTITVTSTGTTVLNSKTLKFLEVSLSSSIRNNSPFTFGRITEIIGGETYLFPFFNMYGADGASVNQMLCYKDSSFPQIQLTANSCTYTSVGIDETTKTGFSLGPVPAGD